MIIKECRVNHLDHPMGYQFDTLSFSWKVENALGKYSSFARIQIAESEHFETVLYDSGKTVLDSRGTSVSINLRPRTRYYWTVTVWSDAGEEAQSNLQWFETGKMDEPWAGHWITCNSEEKRHPIFHRYLSFAKPVKRARLYICGLGFYEAAINGVKIGDEYLTPYCNDYFSWLQYQTFDITKELQGSTDLAITLGNGWYKGRFGYNVIRNRTPVFSRTWKLIAEVRVEFEDDTDVVIGTDENWLVTRSNILFSDNYDGEIVDARLEETPAEPAMYCAESMGKLTARYSVPVREVERLSPIKVMHTPADEWVLDLGQNQAGIFEFNVCEPEGTEILLQFGEIMQDGNFYRGNLRGAKAEYRFLSDGKPHCLKPHFTFYGYRYVKVQGVSVVRKEDFTALVLSSALEKTGSLHTGNDKLNRLIQNVEWSLTSNYIDIPADCPQRDERMGWTGDAQVFSGTACNLRACYPFFRKFLKDMAQEQKKLGGMVPNVVPAASYEGCSSAWGDAACIIPWNLYLYYGDKSIIQEHFEDMRAWVDYIRTVDGTDHGWRSVFHYGDWLGLDHPSGDPAAYRGATENGLIADVYYRNSVQIVAKSAGLLGMYDIQKQYEELSGSILNGIKEEYFTPSGKVCQDTQTAHLLALHFGLSKNPKKEEERLIYSLESAKRIMRTGFIGTPLLCPVLTEIGRTDMAYHFLFNENYPGWLYEVNLGATTIWERWNSVLPSGAINPSGMNSLNHYAFGSILEWMIHTVGGIAPIESCPGFRKAKLAPIPDIRANYAETILKTASGDWKLNWRLEDGARFHLKVTVPFDCQGQLTLPYAPDDIFNHATNPIFQNVSDGVCILEPGSYQLSYVMTRSAEHSLKEIPRWVEGGL